MMMMVTGKECREHNLCFYVCTVYKGDMPVSLVRTVDTEILTRDSSIFSLGMGCYFQGALLLWGVLHSYGSLYFGGGGGGEW